MALTLDDVNLGEHVSGPLLTAAQLRGKVVVVDFWGIECPPCIAELPGYQTLYDRYRHDGFHVAALERQRHSMEAVIAWVIQGRGRGMNLTYQITGGDSTNVAGRYVPMLPVNFLFGADGQMIAAELHGDALESAVREQVQHTWTKMLDVGEPGRLTELADKLKEGHRLMETLSQLALRRRDGKDAEEIKEATRLMFAVFAAGHKKFENATAMQAADPFGAYYKFLALATDLKGTQLGDKARVAAEALRKNDRVQRELAAEDGMKRIIALIVSFKPATGNIRRPENAEFRALNREGIIELEAECRRVRSEYRGTTAGEHVPVVARDFLINIGE